MADIVSKAKRSEIMSKIRSRGNQRTEIAMVKLLRANRITGWRRHYPIEGKPDFAFPKQKVAIFVDGCFWHGCPKCFRMPDSRRDYWVTKILKNMMRDQCVDQHLRRAGWKALRFWEHEMHPVQSVRPLKAVRTICKEIGLP